MNQVRWLMDIPFEVSAHLAKDKWWLNLATGLLPKYRLNRLIFHFMQMHLYEIHSHTELQSKAINCPQTTGRLFPPLSNYLPPISKLQEPVPEEIGCRMPWNADHLSMSKAKAKHHIPTGKVRSQTQILSLINSTYRKQREQKLWTHPLSSLAGLR